MARIALESIALQKMLSFWPSKAGLLNSTSVVQENRAKNRRTRIVVLPKIDEFYDMIEKEMKKQK